MAKNSFKLVPLLNNDISEVLEKKKLFNPIRLIKNVWYLRLVFFLGFWITKKNYLKFWLGGILSRWFTTDHVELESFYLLTTVPNKLIKPISRRMSYFISSESKNNGLKI